MVDPTYLGSVIAALLAGIGGALGVGKVRNGRSRQAGTVGAETLTALRDIAEGQRQVATALGSLGKGQDVLIETSRELGQKMDSVRLEIARLAGTVSSPPAHQDRH